MALFITDPPVGEPITLAEAKAQLRIDTNDEDDLVSSLIAAARRHCEAETGLALITQRWRLTLDDWPARATVLIRKGPVRTIEAVTVYDAVGEPLELDLAGSVLDTGSRPARLMLPARPFPGQAINGIEIDFTAGFGATGAEVPDTLKRAMLTHVGLMYEMRAGIAAGIEPGAVPAGYDRLIAPFCRRAL